jgi:hypothetical protein
MTESKGMRAFWDKRGEQAANLRAQGIAWPKIAEIMNISRQGAVNAAKRWTERQANEASE